MRVTAVLVAASQRGALPCRQPGPVKTRRGLQQRGRRTVQLGFEPPHVELANFSDFRLGIALRQKSDSGLDANPLLHEMARRQRVTVQLESVGIGAAGMPPPSFVVDNRGPARFVLETQVNLSLEVDRRSF